MDDQSKVYLEQEILQLETKINELKELLNDTEFGIMANKEIEELNRQKEELTKAINQTEGEDEAVLDQTDKFKHVLIEARQGVGGDEAKIWADDLLRMYTRYGNSKQFKVETLDENVIKISGKGIFTLLQYETGVHRVQRVPETEAAGRIHTSTASIVVLPEVPENQIVIRDDDLFWEFTRGGGHGGQNVNKVATAVRLTHKPTGIIVQSRQERFQEQNRKIALALLRSQLWEIDQEQKNSKVADQRAKIGRSLRSEKIRTYNYPQNRVTDHRIGKSWYQLDRIMEGNIEDMLTTVGMEIENGNAGDNEETAD
jgi:peptide chain release factor 1